MKERNSIKTGTGKPRAGTEIDRDARLKAALKSNMARRKSQAKARAAASVTRDPDQNK